MKNPRVTPGWPAWLLGLFLLPVYGLAAQDAGTNNPFELGAGARALALGGAYTAAADDVSALFWNPAGLARLDRAEISAMHVSLFYDTPYDFLGFAYPLLDWGTFAAGMARVATNGIVLRDEQSFVSQEATGAVELREILIGYGRELPYGVQAGATVKIDQQRLLGDFAAGVGLDAGMLYRVPKAFGDLTGLTAVDWQALTLGVALQNLVGARLRLDRDTDILPLTVRAGLAYALPFQDAWKQNLLLSAGLEKSTWRSWRWCAGLEYDLLQLLSLRVGMQNENLTAGGGLRYAGLSLDYALLQQELGLSHRLSLTYRFGPVLSEQRREQERRLDREVERRAGQAVEKARAEMNQQLQDSERRFKREKQALLASQNRQLLAERQRQAEQRGREVQQEYFKALHYFQGIKDYLVKRYREALTEFETVAKYDPNYMELPFYLAQCRQRVRGRQSPMNEADLALYYQGIDLYVENKFAEAIEVWKRILQSEPGNLMVLRNIEEAQGRLAALQGASEENRGAQPRKRETPQP